MDTNFEQKVRERAYEIWMSAGRADGMAHEHWVIAEKAVTTETGTPMSATTKTVAVKTTAAKAGTTKAAVKQAAPR